MSNPLLSAAESRQNRVDESWGHLTWLAGRPQGNVEGLTLGHVVLKAGQANPRHAHPNCEEVLYLLAGRVEHTLGDQSFTLEAGDTLAIPAGVFHNGISLGPEDADMIVAYSEGDRQFVLEENGS